MAEMRVLLWVLINLLGIGALTSQQQGQLDLSQKVQDFYTQKNDVLENTNYQALALLPKNAKQDIIFHDAHFRLELGADDIEYYLVIEQLKRTNTGQLELTDNTGKKELISNEDFTAQGRKFTGPFVGNLDMNVVQGDISTLRIKQLYLPPVNSGAMELGFGTSFECHININCDEGTAYEDEKNGVMRIRMVAEEGVALCTGTLLNNTSENKDPLVLTAFHCIKPADTELNPLYDMWLFDFNYESRSCANPDEEPVPLTLQGAEVLSQWEDTDMLLVRILEDIPEESNIYFNGWDRRASYSPQPTVLIHHPAGDIMKVTTDNDPILPFDEIVKWNNGTETSPGSHYINDFDDAVYQPGSSGGAIFDETGKVIGQLHGGPLSDELCEIGIGYSGRLSQSWNTGPDSTQRLREWLDPGDLGDIFIEGIPANNQDQAVQFEGSIITASGEGIPNVSVRIEGDLNATFQTGEDGRFRVENLTTKGAYVMTFEKNTNIANGISASDLVTMQNHILGNKFIDGVFARFAADVNQDGKISVADILEIINLIIGRTTEFRNTPSWNFEPKSIDLNGNNIGAGSLDLDIIGFKMGDVNASADPKL